MSDFKGKISKTLKIIQDMVFSKKELLINSSKMDPQISSLPTNTNSIIILIKASLINRWVCNAWITITNNIIYLIKIFNRWSHLFLAVNKLVFLNFLYLQFSSNLHFIIITIHPNRPQHTKINISNPQIHRSKLMHHNHIMKKSKSVTRPRMAKHLRSSINRIMKS